MIGTKAHRGSKKHRKACKLGGSSDPIGRCRLHKNLTVSVNQMKSRRCLEKNCCHLHKFKDHPFWANQKEGKS